MADKDWEKALHQETRAIGTGYDPASALGAAKPPVYATSTFVYRSAEQARAIHQAFFDGTSSGPDSEGFIYARLGHPNLVMVEDRLAALDQAESAAVFNSGMAAASTTALSFLRPGDSLVFSQPIYGGVDNLIERLGDQFGVHAVGLSDGTDEAVIRDAVAQAARLGPLRLIMLESPANPTAAITDIALVRRIVEDHATGPDRPLILVDNTFLGPFQQTPLALGADLCLTSLTKYCAGHSDMLAGGISGRADLIAAIKRTRLLTGSYLQPEQCVLLLRSFETLALRTERSTANATAVANWLSHHPKIESLTFAGLLPEGSPARLAFERQASGPGSTFSVRLKGGQDAAFAVLNAVRVMRLAVSLGGTETLICHPATTTHYSVPAERRQAAGITDGTLRVSVGLEHVDDLIADFDQALENA